MSNINIECEDDDYYDKFQEESSPRTNYGEGYKTEKMKEEYIIISKTAIQKRIEELERLYRDCEKPSIQGTLYNQLSIELKQILSQSTPLVPEIEKAILEGRNSIHFENDGSYWEDENVVEDYITNLKIDI